MITVYGAGNNVVKMVKDSISPDGVRLYTFELDYWRGFHSENMTHRMLSKNASSTRAIPINKVIDHIRKNTGMPIHWGMNNPGMQSNREISIEHEEMARKEWLDCMEDVISHVETLSDKNGINGHKQWVGRLLEPFSTIKVVLSGTEIANYRHLRKHPSAQPEFKDLLECIDICIDESVPQALNYGEWHLPYIKTERNSMGELCYYSNDVELDLDTARKISTSCCAQASYRKLDESLDKALDIFEKLNLNNNSNDPAHASPTEHQATPMNIIGNPFDPNQWESGITHVRRDGSLWSGNFRGWIQHRQLIPNEAVW